MKAFLIVLLTVICAQASAQQCERKWKKVGCFQDDVTKRPLMRELVNRLDSNSSNFDGKMIDWDHYPKSLHELYCTCAELTEQRGYTHFGLQFYAECWSGPNAAERYGMQGTSDDCIGADYNPCIDSAETECTGKNGANYVYQINRENICKKAIDFGIVMDVSSSVKPDNYDKVKFHERAALKTRTDSIMYSYGGASADKALRLAETEFFCSGCNPAGKPKVLIVITNRNTNHGSEDLGKATQGMKDNRVKIISLGIGSNINTSKLKQIASEPKDKHVFKLANFDELGAKLDSILIQACVAAR